ncbi:sugar transferase [Brachybacterium sp. AOP25-B2-12]|uniref:sugar transferase n=1 Tax=Brachybacterium sp. AOP25-B2-12 TaxID=3457710 RepID=UPI004033E884
MTTDAGTRVTSSTRPAPRPEPDGPGSEEPRLPAQALVDAAPAWTADPEILRPADTDPAAPSGAARVRTSRRHLLVALVGMDVVALALAVLIAYLARQVTPGLGHAGDLPGILQQGAWPIALGWLVAITAFGGYNVRLMQAGSEIFRNVLHASLAAAGIVGGAVYLSGIELSRVFFVALFVAGPPLLLLNRALLRRVLNLLRRRGRMRQSVLAIGALTHVDSIAATVHREGWLGYDVVGALVPAGVAASRSRAGIPVLGAEDDVVAVARALRPAVLLFAAGSSASAEDFRRTAWELEDLDVDVIVVPAVSEISGDRMSMRPVAGLPLVHLDLPRSQDALRRSKRFFDVVASAVLLTVAAPVLAVVALVVRLHDGGPVLFRQTRVGRSGEEFEFLKFRTMGTDAEQRLAELLAEDRDRGNDVLFKLARDPRVTRPGRLLRRFSLDELPQLWNVLRGDMSLVGPRPALPREAARYDQDARRRLSVRPGITGLWQVSGRSDLSWSETVRLDMYYVDNWSFTQDVLILTKTVRAVLASSGAY